MAKWTIASFVKTISQNSTREPLTASNISSPDIIIVAPTGNTGNITLSGKNDAGEGEAGLVMAPGAVRTLADIMTHLPGERSFDLREIYGLAATANDTLRIQYAEKI